MRAFFSKAALRAAATLTAGWCVAFASASNIATWTFETTIPATAGPHAAELGSGSATGFHSDASSVYSNPSGNGSVESFSSNFWSVGDYYQFQVSTTGYNSITIDWDQTSSNTGPRDFQLSYSTDGATFTNVGSVYAVLANAAPNPVWSAGTPQPIFHFGPISLPAGANNQAAVYVRLSDASTISANGGTVATSGTDRVDNVAINGVPEPATLTLLAIGALGLIRRR
ncbi:MAG: PEP-CTERM sorting domain-containing protein [Phycisphaerae bacterium]